MTSRFLRLLAPCLALLLLVGCASGGGAQSVRNGSAGAVTSTAQLGLPDTRANSGAYTGASEYRIGPQDLLEISVFQVDELNRTVRVNSGGQVSLPLIGVLPAGGKTVQELEAFIAAKLDGQYLQNPQVTVFVKEFTSQRVTLEGAVSRPGIYPLTGSTTLLQVMAMAGGVTDLANLQGIVVFRTVDGKKMAAAFDLKAIRSGQMEDPAIYGDDIVVVDRSGPRAAMRRVLEALPVFSIFGIL